MSQPTPADTAPSTGLSPVQVTIYLDHLRHNVRALQEQAGDAQIMGVVKSNAYGHGAVRVAHVLREEGVRHFAVARIAEAIELRSAGITEPLLVLGAPLPHHLPAYAAHNLDVTISSHDVAEAVINAASRQTSLRVHVKVDTGMGRIGLVPDEAASVVDRLQQTEGIDLAGLWTHFATAGQSEHPFAQTQLDRFSDIVQEVGDTALCVHAATEQVDLRPVMQMTAQVTHIKTVSPGTSISYGRRWKADRRTRVATLGAGYGDGYFRVLSNRAEVAVGGQRVPVIGAVCMDMLMVDLGPEEVGPDVAVGDTAVLFGSGGPSAFEVAAWADTIPYEVCCRVAERVPHVYIDRS